MPAALTHRACERMQHLVAAHGAFAHVHDLLIAISCARAKAHCSLPLAPKPNQWQALLTRRLRWVPTTRYAMQRVLAESLTDGAVQYGKRFAGLAMEPGPGGASLLTFEVRWLGVTIERGLGAGWAPAGLGYEAFRSNSCVSAKVAQHNGSLSAAALYAGNALYLMI
jgi:hypothetical protein